MSGKKEAQVSNGGAKYDARLCHVVKRPDFDGYGFNLHAEKGRPGQYIGKVDDGSPAEAAGLRQGDRILEVNGTNITNETHKKVVELIKAVPNETKLLVIDPRADPAELKAAIAAIKNGQQAQQGGGVDVNDNSKQAVVAMEKQMMPATNGKGGAESPEKEKKHQAAAKVADVSSTEDTNNKKNSSKSNGSSANNNDDTSANKMMMTNGDATKKTQQKPVVDQIIEDTKALSVSAPSATKSESNGKPATNGAATTTTVTKEGPKLNLNMTAAELRAQLAARKKYDPKNDVCDLRKKYEIIQKM